MVVSTPLHYVNRPRQTDTRRSNTLESTWVLDLISNLPLRKREDLSELGRHYPVSTKENTTPRHGPEHQLLSSEKEETYPMARGSATIGVQIKEELPHLPGPGRKSSDTITLMAS